MSRRRYGRLKRSFIELNRMSIKTFQEHFDLGLRNLEFHLLDYTVEGVRRHGTLSVLSSDL